MAQVQSAIGERCAIKTEMNIMLGQTTGGKAFSLFPGLLPFSLNPVMLELVYHYCVREQRLFTGSGWYARRESNPFLRDNSPVFLDSKLPQSSV